jgi:iron complex outermembrane receptor protein
MLRPSLLLLLLCLATNPVLAQAPSPPGSPPDPVPGDALTGPSLEELMTIKVDTVSGAAKREQLVTEAPSSVTVVTAQEIATYGWRTLAEVLRATRGFYVTYDRNYAYLGARGFGRPTDYNNRVLFLINGHRLNDNVFDAVGIGTDFPVDIQLVDRIEIIRGPGSALYGTSAFFAVVDVILKKGAALGGVEGSVESASLGTWRARGSFGTSDERGHDLLLSVSHLTSDGAGALRYPEYDDPITGPGISVGADGDRASTMFGSVRLGGLAIEGAVSEREKHLPTGAWGTVLSEPGSQTIDSRAWAGATWRGDVGATALTVRGFYDHMRYEGAYVSEDSAYTEFAGGDWLVGEITASRTLSSRHRLTYGSEYREHLRQMQVIDEGAGPFEDNHRSRQLGLHVQDEIRLGGKVSAVLGARADYWTLDGWSAHPRLGLVVRPDADTALKLLYGGAYRAPNAYERFYTQDGFLANPALKPETLRTSEAVVERYVGGRLRLSASAYVTRIDSLISQVALDDELATSANASSAHAVGGEFEAERRWVNGLLMRGSLVLQDVDAPPTHVRLSNSPGTLGLFRMETPVGTRRATLALDWQYVGERITDLGATADAYALTNLTLRVTPRGMRGAIAASVYNLFDTAYADPVGAEFRQELIGQDGRTFSVRFTVGF